MVIANSARFGAGMQVAPPALIDDGLLDIVRMRHGPKLAFVRVLLRIRGGTHVTLPLISLDRAAAVTLTMDRADAGRRRRRDAAGGRARSRRAPRSPSARCPAR